MSCTKPADRPASLSDSGAVGASGRPEVPSQSRLVRAEAVACRIIGVGFRRSAVRLSAQEKGGAPGRRPIADSRRPAAGAQRHFPRVMMNSDRAATHKTVRITRSAREAKFDQYLTKAFQLKPSASTGAGTAATGGGVARAGAGAAVCKTRASRIAQSGWHMVQLGGRSWSNGEAPGNGYPEPPSVKHSSR